MSRISTPPPLTLSDVVSPAAIDESPTAVSADGHDGADARPLAALDALGVAA